MTESNGYSLSRNFWDFAFENPEKIKPAHAALFFFAVEHCNRLGWKSKFGLPTGMAMEAIGLKSYNTYKLILDELIGFGMIKMVEKSKNQYSANIIALSKNDKAQYKALDKALMKHGTKHHTKQSESTIQSTIQSIDSIDKPITIEPITIEQVKRFTPPTQNEVFDFMCTRIDEFTAMAQSEKFFNYYESNGWIVGRSKMKKWKAAVNNWISNMTKFSTNGQSKQGTSEARTERAKNW